MLSMTLTSVVLEREERSHPIKTRKRSALQLCSSYLLHCIIQHLQWFLLWWYWSEKGEERRNVGRPVQYSTCSECPLLSQFKEDEGARKQRTSYYFQLINCKIHNWLMCLHVSLSWGQWPYSHRVISHVICEGLLYAPKHLHGSRCVYLGQNHVNSARHRSWKSVFANIVGEREKNILPSTLFISIE